MLALRKYEELTRLHPEMAAARANLGVVLASLGRFDEAIVQYRAALEQVPGNPALRLNLAAPSTEDSTEPCMQERSGVCYRSAGK